MNKTLKVFLASIIGLNIVSLHGANPISVSIHNKTAHGNGNMKVIIYAGKAPGVDKLRYDKDGVAMRTNWLKTHTAAAEVSLPATTDSTATLSTGEGAYTILAKIPGDPNTEEKIVLCTLKNNSTIALEIENAKIKITCGN